MRTRPLSSSNSVPSPGEPRSGFSPQSTKPKAALRLGHKPVLLHEVIHALDIQEDDVVVDATVGGGGHALALVKGLGGNGLFIGFDADADAVARARRLLADSGVSARLICSNFRDMERELANIAVESVTKVLFDLGWSSYQLDSGLPGQGRGFSFSVDEPLLMTYSKENGELTAKTIVNTWTEKSLADIIFGFGEERYARKIAKVLVERRVKKPFKTSKDLADVIAATTPARYRRPGRAGGKLHPATRTFQALRIAVNDELAALEEGLVAAWRLLRPGGRVAVISFHSIEDRIVKRWFKELARRGEARELQKKPVRPSPKEVAENPRARSAKLRAIEKVVSSQ